MSVPGQFTAPSVTTVAGETHQDVRVEYLYHGPLDPYCEISKVITADEQNVVDQLDEDTLIELENEALDDHRDEGEDE